VRRQKKEIPFSGREKYEAREMTWAEQDRFRERTMVERVNARLKDEFGGRQIRVRGAILKNNGLRTLQNTSELFRCEFCKSVTPVRVIYLSFFSSIYIWRLTKMKVRAALLKSGEYNSGTS
jgi:hypothetical protein